MQKSPSLFRVFHFECDDLPYSIAVDHSPDLAGQEQESYVTGQFYTLLEAVLPGRRAAGEITGITWFDDVHPDHPPESARRKFARLNSRAELAHAVAE